MVSIWISGKPLTKLVMTMIYDAWGANGANVLKIRWQIFPITPTVLFRQIRANKDSWNVAYNIENNMHSLMQILTTQTIS